MSIESIIGNALRLDDDGVWVRPDAKPFAYTDGLRAEAYLEQVLRSTEDLSSDSAALEARAKDWQSEYHLTRKRAQLLRGFDFERSGRVLEVGCGCGAVTRFLGESFERVVSIEGSHARARLARLRTRDLENVGIVASPFQELRFNVRFDFLFCIGVYEYASAFVDAADPHASILDCFDELLAPDGVLVLAIENQFGLKYFGASAEDHTAAMFDGIEGYPRFRRKARTFGREALRRQLAARFETVDFYYPWPDYKVPSCVISEGLIDAVDVGELIGAFPSRDHGKPRRRPLFSEALAWKEIAANRMVPQMANSFLVFAAKGHGRTPSMDALGRVYSSGRRPEFCTTTRLLARPQGAVEAVKVRTHGGDRLVEGRLEHRETAGEWVHGPSLQGRVERRARARDLSLAEIFEPARAWFEDLRRAAQECGGGNVPGDRLDSIWRNCFVSADRCRYIDREWVWTEPIPLPVVVARGLYYFGQSLLRASDLSPVLSGMPVGRLVRSVAGEFGVRVDAATLQALAEFEAAFLDQVSGRGHGRAGVADVKAVLRRRLDGGVRDPQDALVRRGLRWLERRLRG